MSEVVEPDVFKVGAVPHAIPVVSDVRQPRARFAARDHPGIVGSVRQACQNPRRRRRQRNHARTGLAVRQAEDKSNLL